MNAGIPWKRFSVEAVVVVVSILMAFAIEAWWSDRQNRLEAEELITLLRSELEDNINKIDELIPYRNAVWEVTQRITAASNENIEMSSVEFDEHIADLFWWPSSGMSVATLNSFLVGGKLSLISDPYLSTLIGNVFARMESVWNIEKQENITTRSELLPLFIQYGSLAQIGTIYESRERPGGLVRSDLESNFEVSQPRDHRALLENDEFVGLVLLKGWDQDNSMNIYRLLKQEINVLLDYLDRM